MMYMFMDFKRDVQFIFQSWYAKADENPIYFALGLVATFIYCSCHTGILPRIEESMKKRLLLNAKSNKIKQLTLNTFHLIFQLSNIVVMMLMMSMNFWVGITISLGCAFGYASVSAQKDYSNALIATKTTSSNKFDSFHTYESISDQSLILQQYDLSNI